MSFNQSRPDKNQEYLKSGRSASSNQLHMGFSAAYAKGNAGPAIINNNNRCLKTNNNNAQGGQSRATVATLNPSDSGIAAGGVQNGAHLQSQLHGASDVPFTSTAPKQTESPAPQGSSRTVPKAPTSQNASMTSETRVPTTPATSPGGASKGFSFQFGSLSPGLVNGMQIPARTSSAPPNLDEQKRDQVCHDCFRTVPSQPTPSVPKQQLPRKDHASVDQANAAEAYLVPKTKKDVQVSPAPLASQNQKPSGHLMAGMSMLMPFHNIDNATTLANVVLQIYDKAVMEPTFCEMYANICFHLAGVSPDFSEGNEKLTFKRLLVNKCQEEFEKEREKTFIARRRMLGNIVLIGELFKKKMLTERIMHECITRLSGQQHTPDEEDIEALCKLMSTIGEMIDRPKAKEHMDAYFEKMQILSNNMKLSLRVRFMLKDAIDLRKNKWQKRRKVEGPKKIEDVHRDAAQERQAQTIRLGYGPGINPSARGGAPMDFSPKGSPMLSSLNPQMGGFRGMPTLFRGYGCQDPCIDERHSYESRTLSLPLTQRPLGDDSITLGPQGGIAKGMSRGSPSMSPGPLADIPSAGDSSRMPAGLNGFSSLSKQAATYNRREDLLPRYMPDTFAGPAAYDQSSAPERNINFGGRDPRNSDHSFDRSLPTSPPKRAQGAALPQNAPSEKVPTEERLRDMSLAAIEEFYSARDEKEVALCIKDLNSPSFHPSMISLWVTDTFEREDTERDLLAKLLVNLTKLHDGALSQSQLIKGFETVLSTLEDAVNDAPKAPEFLGLIFAKVILENVVSLKQIWQLIYEGGEEPGHLLEVGLAGNLLGNILEIIKSEKGESVLNEIRSASNLRLETFRPPDPLKSRILENFI